MRWDVICWEKEDERWVVTITGCATEEVAKYWARFSDRILPGSIHDIRPMEM